MTIWKSEILWHDARLMCPAKSGKYLIEKGFIEKRVDMMSYTPAGGWNTFMNAVGEMDTKHAIDNRDGYITLWAELPIPKGVEV